MRFEQNLKRLKELDLEGASRDFLLTWEKRDHEILATLLTAECLKTLHGSGKSLRLFDTGMAVSIFRDNSTRTRFSFASACNALGLGLQDLDEEKTQIAHGETLRETATMISFLTEVIGIRDDIYLGEGNRYMREVAAAVEEGFSEGVLHQRPMVLNLQCDVDHPTQTLADLCHLKDRFGSLEAIQGKKIAVTWAYSPSYGKPLSVPQGLIGLLTRFGMHVHLAHPEGYDLLPDVVERAQKQAERSGGTFTKGTDMEEAFENADVVYPKSWASYRVMEKRTELLKKADRQGLQDLESACLEENARHKSWECNERIMARTRKGEALYMHCLPADISGVSQVHGEVSAKVFEANRLHTYRQAGFKPFVIAAMILLGRTSNPAAALEKLAATSSSL